MKRFLVLMLALAFALSAGLALCEEADAYRPGEITKNLIQGSMQPGRHLGVSLSGVFDPGMNLAPDEEVQAVLDSLSLLLERSALRVGYARVKDGVRLDFGGYIQGEDESLVYSYNAVTLNHDGLIFESDLLEDRRFFIGWETILEQLGVEDTGYGDLFLEMAEQDVTDWIGGWIEEHAGQMLEAALPYFGVAAGWIASLPFEPVDTVGENSPVPAMPGMMRVSVTRADVSRLCGALLDQLENPEDKLHSWLLHIPMYTEEMLGDTIEELRYNLPSGTDDHPLVLSFALPDGEQPVPFALAAEYEGDIRVFRFGLSGQQAEDGGTTLFALRFFHSEKADPEAGVPKDTSFALTADLSVTPDPADSLVYAVTFSAEAETDGAPLFSTTYAGTSTAFTAESGQPGYHMTQSAQAAVQGETSFSQECVSDWVRTEEDGESFLLHETREYGDSEASDAVSAIQDVSWVIEPVENGLFDAAFSWIVSVPSYSLEAAGVNAQLYGDEYEPTEEGLNTVYFDELSGEEIADLESELKAALRSKLSDVLEVLPEALVPYAMQLTGGEIPDDDHEQFSDEYWEGYSAGFEHGFQAGLDASLTEDVPWDAEDSTSPEAGEENTVD